MVRYAFILLDSFAITVEPFVVLDSNTGNEHGARIQVRRVQAATEPGTQLAEPIWRGDLFRLTRGPADNWDRAHYHPRFEGLQAGSRVTDPQLTQDPITWALARRDSRGAREVCRAVAQLIDGELSIRSRLSVKRSSLRRRFLPALSESAIITGRDACPEPQNHIQQHEMHSYFC